jgi:hypothetical protein
MASFRLVACWLGLGVWSLGPSTPATAQAPYEGRDGRITRIIEYWQPG